ncbi:alpha/beta hydrolase [Mangrovicoccus ximenensis]|uniref:alpha/beta hydrolase n=1 Tax=Mangrovicoccus ximenensis TaxID=1911570 RepID=UPI000D33BEAA|nr:alpha/beta fold hydrolase [Mangrovicoccus ximenensis]
MPTLRQIDISHRGLTLCGTFYPADRSPMGTVMLAHGFSGNRIGPGRLLSDFARRLQAEGFAVLAFDRAGHGESEGAFADVTVPDELAQLSEMLDYAQGPSRAPVHLVGHSLGAMELACLAAERPEDVASLHLWAPAANFADELRAGQIQGRSLAALDEGRPFDFQGQALGPAFRDTGLAFDPLDGLERIACPVSLHHGSEDAIVPPAVTETYLMRLPQAVRRLYPLADHGFARHDQREPLMAATLDAILEAARARQAA